MNQFQKLQSDINNKPYSFLNAHQQLHRQHETNFNDKNISQTIATEREISTQESLTFMENDVLEEQKVYLQMSARQLQRQKQYLQNNKQSQTQSINQVLQTIERPIQTIPLGKQNQQKGRSQQQSDKFGSSNLNTTHVVSQKQIFPKYNFDQPFVQTALREQVQQPKSPEPLQQMTKGNQKNIQDKVLNQQRQHHIQKEQIQQQQALKYNKRGQFQQDHKQLNVNQPQFQPRIQQSIPANQQIYMNQKTQSNFENISNLQTKNQKHQQQQQFSQNECQFLYQYNKITQRQKQQQPKNYYKQEVKKALYNYEKDEREEQKKKQNVQKEIKNKKQLSPAEEKFLQEFIEKEKKKRNHNSTPTPKTNTHPYSNTNNNNTNNNPINNLINNPNIITSSNTNTNINKNTNNNSNNIIDLNPQIQNQENQKQNSEQEYPKFGELWAYLIPPGQETNYNTKKMNKQMAISLSQKQNENTRNIRDNRQIVQLFEEFIAEQQQFQLGELLEQDSENSQQNQNQQQNQQEHLIDEELKLPEDETLEQLQQEFQFAQNELLIEESKREKEIVNILQNDHISEQIVQEQEEKESAHEEKIYLTQRKLYSLQDVIFHISERILQLSFIKYEQSSLEDKQDKYDQITDYIDEKEDQILENLRQSLLKTTLQKPVKAIFKINKNSTVEGYPGFLKLIFEVRGYHYKNNNEEIKQIIDDYSENDIVLISRQIHPPPIVCNLEGFMQTIESPQGLRLGIVQMVEINKQVKILINCGDDSFLDKEELYLLKLCSLSPTISVIDTLLSFNHDDQWTTNMILNPQLRNIEISNEMQEQMPTMLEKQWPKLDSSQINAILNIYAAKCQKLEHCYFLIHGQDGNGKTSMISYLIWILMKEITNKNTKILVCTKTKAQLTTLIRFFEFLIFQEQRNFNYIEYDREVIQKSKNDKNQYNQLLNQIKNAKLIFVTLYDCFHISAELQANCSIDTLIVDDAYFCSEIDMWFPLFLKPNFVVLLGNPIYHQSKFAQMNQYFPNQFYRSICDRVLKNSISQQGDSIKPFDIIYHYRSHPQLTEFMMTYFEGSQAFKKLQHKTTYKNKKSLVGMTNICPCRINFLQISSYDIKEDYLFIQEILEQYLQLIKIKHRRELFQSSVILVPTSYDKMKLKEFLNNCVTGEKKLIIEGKVIRSFNIKDTQVKTFEESQGREWDLVIISPAYHYRSLTKDEEIDALFQDKFTISAIASRAKQFLVIVGNFYTLKNYKSWGEFLEKVKIIQQEEEVKYKKKQKEKEIQDEEEMKNCRYTQEVLMDQEEREYFRFMKEKEREEKKKEKIRVETEEKKQLKEFIENEAVQEGYELKKEDKIYEDSKSSEEKLKESDQDQEGSHTIKHQNQAHIKKEKIVAQEKLEIDQMEVDRQLEFQRMFNQHESKASQPLTSEMTYDELKAHIYKENTLQLMKNEKEKQMKAKSKAVDKENQVSHQNLAQAQQQSSLSNNQQEIMQQQNPNMIREQQKHYQEEYKSQMKKYYSYQKENFEYNRNVGEKRALPINQYEEQNERKPQKRRRYNQEMPQQQQQQQQQPYPSQRNRQSQQDQNDGFQYVLPKPKRGYQHKKYKRYND